MPSLDLSILRFWYSRGGGGVPGTNLPWYWEMAVYITYTTNITIILFFLSCFCIYLFLATLGLCCFWVDFSLVAGDRGSSLVAVGRLSSCGTRALEHRLSSCSSVAPWHVGSSQTRDQTCVPCIGRRILIPLCHQGSPHWHYHNWY